jgi:hypothetical protein
MSEMKTFCSIADCKNYNCEHHMVAVPIDGEMVEIKYLFSDKRCPLHPDHNKNFNKDFKETC